MQADEAGPCHLALQFDLAWVHQRVRLRLVFVRAPDDDVLFGRIAATRASRLAGGASAGNMASLKCCEKLIAAAPY